MTPIRVDSERRVEAPHPGPQIKRDYVDALGLTVSELATHVGLEVERLTAMLAGTRSLDVEATIRISRALQLPAERIMRMQMRRDFADARSSEVGSTIEVFVPRQIAAFPQTFVPGRLARANDAGDGSFFFQQTLEGPVVGDSYAGLHALWRGDLLRVYEPAGGVLWHGPVLTDFDGHVQLPYVRAETWIAWFVAGHRADIHFGAEHAEFFERMDAPGGASKPRG